MVRGEYDRFLALLQVPYEVPNRKPRLRIHCNGRLVKECYAWVVYECQYEAQPALHASAVFSSKPIGILIQPHLRKQCISSFPYFHLRHTLKVTKELNILFSSQIRKDRGLLR